MSSKHQNYDMTAKHWTLSRHLSKSVYMTTGHSMSEINIFCEGPFTHLAFQLSESLQDKNCLYGVWGVVLDCACIPLSVFDLRDTKDAVVK